MTTFRQKLVNFAAKIYFRFSGGGLKQEELTAGDGRERFISGELLCRAAAEGAVLLKNDGTLPLKDKFALFGRVQTDTFYTGYGSGGNVLKPYGVSILEGLQRDPDLTFDVVLAEQYRAWAKEHPADHGDWGNWPYRYPEMPLDERLVKDAAKRCAAAVVVIGRAAGEDRENELKEGSYYLAEGERAMLRLVKKHFAKVAVLLNIGSVMDFSWLEDYEIGAALALWQGGMEAGNACAKLLSGKISPCGKLADTVARAYGDYPSAENFGNAEYNEYREDIYVGYRYFSTFAPEKVLFPFGYGLSYTRFTVDASAEERGCVRWRAVNTGACAGKEVVQIYVQKPCGNYGNPARELAGFAKTKLLLAGESEEGEIALADRAFCSYDSLRSLYVMPVGTYRILAGTDSASAKEIFSFSLGEEKIVERLREQCAPASSFPVLANGEGKAKYLSAPAAQKDLKAEIASSIPAETVAPKTGTLRDVREGKLTVKEFAAGLTRNELEAISRGDYVMNSPLGAKGNAGVLGGVLPSLREKGVPALTLVDGPSGIRLSCACSLLPIGTALACTFDPALAEEIYAAVGREMKERGAHVLLAPAMNLHRNPLCGRNFEYYSEDPLLTGKIAAAAVRGLQGEGVAACPKHFACNNQEFNRSRNDSRVSERALRELYLRAFEICVKEASPRFFMTSYNKINGVWAHYGYELCRGILRGEWGYDGCIVTDWWMRKARCPQFPKLRVNAYRVRAGVNVLMPGGGYVGRRKPDGTLLESLGKKDGITLAELHRNAEEILNVLLDFIDISS